MTKQEWLDNPYTQKLVKNLEEAVDAMEDAWSSGNFFGEDFNATIQANLNAAGRTSGIKTVLEFIYNIDQDEENAEGEDNNA